MSKSRKQLQNFISIDHFFNSLSSSSNIIIISGAGISVSCGIPDFRSKIGIYNTIKCHEIGLPVAELLFDLKFFEMEPEPFYRYAKELIPPNNIEPSLSHKFIAFLESQNKLLRNYTQNFDGLEKIAGVTRYIQSHGSIETFKCLKCKKKTTLDYVREDILNGDVPLCKSCHGILKPNIVFFGELLDNHLLKTLEQDAKLCDLVIVMGTSLKVDGPVISFLNKIDPKIPQVLINMHPVVPPKSISNGFDISLVGDCDTIIQYICDYFHWDLNSLNHSNTPNNLSSSPSLITLSSTISPINQINILNESSNEESLDSIVEINHQNNQIITTNSENNINSQITNSNVSNLSSSSSSSSSSTTTTTTLIPTSITNNTTNITSRRSRRLPSYLTEDYGLYRDDQRDDNHEIISFDQTQLYSSVPTISGNSTKSTKSRNIVKKRKLKIIEEENQNTIKNSNNRELRQLHRHSDGFIDLNLSRQDRRIKMIEKLSQPKIKTCPELINGTKWNLTEKRIYEFQKIQSNENIITNEESEENDDEVIIIKNNNRRRKTY